MYSDIYGIERTSAFRRKVCIQARSSLLEGTLVEGRLGQSKGAETQGKSVGSDYLAVIDRQGTAVASVRIGSTYRLHPFHTLRSFLTPCDLAETDPNVDGLIN